LAASCGHNRSHLDLALDRLFGEDRGQRRIKRCHVGEIPRRQIQNDAERLSEGRWPLLAPWLHTAALPVFAVLSVVVALVYRAVENWLSDYESYARETAARASRLLGSLPAPRPTVGELVAPRSLFGLAFEVRPPPAPA